MKIKRLLIFGVLILFFSCKKENSKNELTTIDSKINETQSDLQFIENDTIVKIWLRQLKEIPLSKFKVVKEPFKNKFDNKIIDTIETLTFKTSKIVLYKGQSLNLIMNAKIENNLSTLYKNIKIGVEKIEVEKLLGTKIKGNYVDIGNLEQTNLFTFQFKNNKLTLIEYEGYVD